MNNKFVKISIFIFVLFFAIFGNYQSLLKNKIINTKEKKIIIQKNYIKLCEDSILSINKYIIDKKLEKFNFVKKRFKLFNPTIKDSTIKKFIDVVEYFYLDSTQENFNLFVHEIILESGAKQYYPIGHTKHGNVITSYAGALGIGQIMPNTAFSFLKRIVDSNDMYNLGCENFNWVYKDKGLYSPKKKYTKNKIKTWLSNETNNIVLWGAIMKYSINKNKNNTIYALISYNAGNRGLTSFLNSGSNPISHSYIKGILKKEQITKEKLN